MLDVWDSIPPCYYAMLTDWGIKPHYTNRAINITENSEVTKPAISAGLKMFTSFIITMVVTRRTIKMTQIIKNNIVASKAQQEI